MKYSRVGGVADVDVAGQTVRLHPRGGVDGVAEQTVAGHLHAHDAGHHRARVQPDTDLKTDPALSLSHQVYRLTFASSGMFTERQFARARGDLRPLCPLLSCVLSSQYVSLNEGS